MSNYQIRSYKKQNGVSLVGAAIMIALIFFILVIAMKIFPAYSEFMAVKKELHAMSTEPLSTMSKVEIGRSFDKRASIDDIKSVTGADLIIEKNSTGETVVSVQYQVKTPVIGNVSTLIDFSTSSDAK